jgi:hypothetical protein
LPSSSVQQSASGTNPTGGLRLVQDDFRVGGTVIDQASYFRNTVFAGYNWSQVRANPFVEVATVPFELIIGGSHEGSFNLEVRHKPSGVASQGNYTTSISWGAASQKIAQQNLTNLKLELFAPTATNSSFLIHIS